MEGVEWLRSLYMCRSVWEGKGWWLSNWYPLYQRLYVPIIVVSTGAFREDEHISNRLLDCTVGEPPIG